MKINLSESGQGGLLLIFIICFCCIATFVAFFPPDTIKDREENASKLLTNMDFEVVDYSLDPNASPSVKVKLIDNNFWSHRICAGGVITISGDSDQSGWTGKGYIKLYDESEDQIRSICPSYNKEGGFTMLKGDWLKKVMNVKVEQLCVFISQVNSVGAPGGGELFGKTYWKLNPSLPCGDDR